MLQTRADLFFCKSEQSCHKLGQFHHSKLGQVLLKVGAAVTY